MWNEVESATPVGRRMFIPTGVLMAAMGSGQLWGQGLKLLP